VLAPAVLPRSWLQHQALLALQQVVTFTDKCGSVHLSACRECMLMARRGPAALRKSVASLLRQLHQFPQVVPERP
jgi:hypothetical protein